MVKNKKMSKTSIAIIVLSVLLVLSLIMGLTGAWFTDKMQDVSNSTTLTFGEIELETVSAAVDDGQTTIMGTIIPGDRVAFTANVKLTAASEDSFVMIFPSTEAINLYVDQTHLDAAFDYAFADFDTVSGWTEITGHGVEGAKLYYVAKGSNAMVVTGYVEVDENLANVGYNANGQAVRVNSANGSYNADFGIKATAIQARNFSAKTSGWSSSEIAAIVAELDTYADVAAARD